ncbi:MAG TPA: hypothetical protein QF764_09005 [Planctomycetota bacterium]|nr:hypothetical protein [Planctomycetota bacterium]
MLLPDVLASPDSGELDSRPGILLVLALVTAGALAGRLWALGGGLPFQSDSDAVIVAQAMGLERGAPRSGENAISPLYPHLPALSLVALPGKVVRQAPADAEWAAHARAAAHPHLLARRWLALLSTLAIPGVFVLARRFLPPAWALLAACLMAACLLHLIYSRQARPHGVLTAFSLWAVVSAMWLARRPTPSAIAACSTCTALAMGVLHSGAAVLPAVALASFLAARRRAGLARAACALPLLAAYLSYHLFYPFVATVGILATRHELIARTFDGSGFASIARSLWAFDPVLTALAVAGLLYAFSAAWRRRTRKEPWLTSDAVLLCAFALPYLLVLGAYYRTLHRFAMPLMPILALLGAVGVMEIARRAAGRCSSASGRRRVTALVVCAALALPFAASSRWLWLTTRPNSAQVAARWLEEHVSLGTETVAISAVLRLPLPRDPQSWATIPEYARSPMQRYLDEHPATPSPGPAYLLRALIPPADAEHTDLGEASMAALLAELSPRYAVVALPNSHSGFADGTRAAVLAAGGERVERIETYPFRSARDLPRHRRGGPLGYEAFAFALRGLRRGRTIEIYRMP